MANKYSLVVVGGGGVGKSAITLSFMRGQFVEEYDPTIEDSYSKQCVIDGVESTLDITDTAGQEEYRGLWGDKFMRNGDGFLCVYSITSKSSFEELEVFKDQILRAKDVDTCPIIILGNKCDLQEYREVSEAEGKEFAKKSGAIFMETSAKERINIEEAFYAIVRHIRDSRTKGSNPAPSAGGGAGGAGSKSGGGGAQKEKADGGCCILL